MEQHRELIAAVAGYVIGASTLFIAFGVNDITPTTGTVAKAVVPESTQAAAAVASTTISEVIENEKGLFVIVNGDERVVSAHADTDVVPGPAYHLSITEYELSPDKTKLFYCAQVSTEANECAGFVYNAVNHSIKVVKEGNEPAFYNADSVSFAW